GPNSRFARACGPLKAWLAKRSDATLALLCAAIVFALVAWPLLIVEVPPYQDVANHLAAVTVADHPADYPELVFTGYLKTNAAFYAWEHFVGHAVGALAAIRLFSALVLAAGALAFTRLLVALRGRRELLAGALFLPPMVHSFCVCLGLLDFSLGFALALLLLALMIEQRRAPSAARAGWIALTSVALWYTHIIPFFLAGVLVLGQLLGPSSVHMRSYASIWLAPWDLLQNLWVQYFLAFTPRSASTLVPCVALAVIGWRSRRERLPFFGPAAFAVLGALYATVPYVLSFWAFANTRVEPFLW